MKNRSIIKLENFLLISTKTLGASALAFLASWFVVPVRAVRDARGVSRELSRSFFDVFPDIYNENVYHITQIPLDAYTSAKIRAEQRLQEFDAKSK